MAMKKKKQLSATKMSMIKRKKPAKAEVKRKQQANAPKQKPSTAAGGVGLGQQSRKKPKSKASKQRNQQMKLDEQSEEDDEDILENVRDIMEENDLKQYMSLPTKARKRKAEDSEEVTETGEMEDDYAKQSAVDNIEKRAKVVLLPIKSRDGEIIVRTKKLELPTQKKKVTEEVEEEDGGADEEYDSDEDVLYDTPEDNNSHKKVISTTDLFIRRQQEIMKQKYRIGIICSGIMERPNDKMKNISSLFDLIEELNENGAPNLFTIRKIAILSVTEIFKDVLPEYRVGQIDTKMTTVRKATLERVASENSMLSHFKKYLQLLEKITSSVTKKGSKGRSPQSIKMAEIGVTCLCDLLLSHPYFNYVQNIAQLLVYILNCNFSTMRKQVEKCFSTFFATDKRFDMTLYIIRRINHLIKSNANNVYLETIKCLLSVKIKNINLDAEKVNELKQKKMESHRQRLISLSRKEKKRAKRLTEINKELQETKAEENKQTKHFKLTEITKLVFTIYFRILKNDPNSGALSACLEGLAEFAHVINLEIFSDLIEVLNNIIETKTLGYKDQLHCIQTIFVILSGQGEVLNIDLLRFYGHLYRNILVVNAGKNHQDFALILRTLNEVLIKRRKNMTQHRLLAFIKRICTLCLQLLHNGTLASLGIVKSVMQLTSSLDIILDTDSSLGSGRFDPEIDDPEYCNASCTTLYELSLLAKHHHPTVRKIATNIMNGVPSSGDGSLPVDIGKLNPEDLWEKFDSSQMAFNPTITVPKKLEPKLSKGNNFYVNPSFKGLCAAILKKEPKPAQALCDLRNSLCK